MSGRCGLGGLGAVGQGFYPLHECATLEDAQDLLCAAAAAPPVMPPVKIKGICTFDGGYTDNAPIVPQTEVEKAATMVLHHHYEQVTGRS